MRRYGESKTHEKQKERIANILRDRGFEVSVDSQPFKCQTEKGERTYWPDVYAENYCLCYNTRRRPNRNGDIQTGGRRIIVEIQGPGSHHSKAAFQADRNRIKDIRECHGNNIEYYTVSLNKARARGPMDFRTWSRLDIEQHLGLE